MTRAIAHELAEIQGLANGAPTGAPAMRPGSSDTENTHHDLGRKAEVDVLLYQLDNGAPAGRADKLRELKALLDHLGFDAEKIGSDRRAQGLLGGDAVTRIDELYNKPRVSGKPLPELVHVSDTTSKTWTVGIGVLLPNGKEALVAQAVVKLDAAGRPDGSLSFTLNNEVRSETEVSA